MMLTMSGTRATAKSISPVRPSWRAEPEVKVNWVLQVYYAKVHHDASGGSGDPDWMGVFGEPRKDTARPLDVRYRKAKKGWVCSINDEGWITNSDPKPTRYEALESLREKADSQPILTRTESDKVYFSTLDKYDHGPTRDTRILHCQSLMKAALVDTPTVVRAYLLWKWPTQGVYRPSARSYRVFDHRQKRWFDVVPDEEDPVGSFVEAGFGLSIPGFVGSKDDVARFKKFLRNRENVVKSRLRTVLEGERETKRRLSSSETVTV